MKTTSVFSDLSYFLRRAKVAMIFRAPPIIIGGCGRSGTTLLASILSAHPRIYVIPAETVTFCPGAYSENVDWNAEFDTRRFFLKYFSNYNFSFSQWCEKTPKNVIFFDRILKHFKNRVRLIHIVRDGRDVIFSRHPRDPDKYWVPGERWIYDVSEGLRHKNNPNVCTVRYEDLVMSFKETLRTILKFLNLKPVPSVFNFHKHATLRESIAWSTGIQPLHNKSIGRWKNHKDENIFKDFMENPQAIKLLKELEYI
ncbi:sulfotransferase [Thermodesulfobacteriota bacterium]